jgi:hypothetical protein
VCAFAFASPKGAINVTVAATGRTYTLAKQPVPGQPGRGEDLAAWADSLAHTLAGRYAEAASVGQQEVPIDARMTIDPMAGPQGNASGEDGGDEFNPSLAAALEGSDEDDDEGSAAAVETTAEALAAARV